MTDAEDPEASPDELLLELMDLTQLAFPESLAQMTIKFVEADDRKRPALTDLDGVAVPGAPKRPDLGHGDNAVLDAINSLIVDLADATLRKGGVRVLTGRLEVKTGDDGDRFVELIDTAGEPTVMMRRRFDKSELRWLFWTPELYRALESTAAREAEQKSALETELRPYDAFRIDMTGGTIAFSSTKPSLLALAAGGAPPDGSAGASYGFALLGSWAEADKRFLWGFANEQSPERVRRAVDAVRVASPDMRALTEASFGCPEPCAYRLARHACARIEGSRGVYRAPFTSSRAKGFLYLALT